jgi:acetylornithine deacetylase/succinyl-diaminopimelate desuccinylase-like protein
MDSAKICGFVDQIWQQSILPALMEYIRIPAISSVFEPQWQALGHIECVALMAEHWCQDQDILGMQTEVMHLPGRTPLLYLDIPGNSENCVLLYGHLDKQPEMSGWDEGLGPWQPVLRGERLYGRGGADDGYAVFASVAAIRSLQEQGVPRARCVILIECSEESGSLDLPAYIDALAERIGHPSLVVCLDSGAGNYEQLWCTTSLRGLVSGDLVVEVLEEGVHSGDASGIVPSSFRIIRQLLERLEDARSGEIIPLQFHGNIPPERVDQAVYGAEILGDAVYTKFPWIEGMWPMGADNTERVLNRTWRPALSVTGTAGLPLPNRAGNVLRPSTTLKLSLRLPPSVDAQAASLYLKQLLEQSPPYGAKVRFNSEQAASGWNAPVLSPWLEKSLAQASNIYFGKPVVYMGEGGSIPFMGMLGERFPEAQFVVTGVLGPHSNAHGPNEFLHIPTAKRLTCCVAQVIADHYQYNLASAKSLDKH